MFATVDLSFACLFRHGVMAMPVTLIGWISDTIPRGLTDLLSPVIGVVVETVCSHARLC